MFIIERTKGRIFAECSGFQQARAPALFKLDSGLIKPPPFSTTEDEAKAVEYLPLNADGGDPVNSGFLKSVTSKGRVMISRAFPNFIKTLL